MAGARRSRNCTTKNQSLPVNFNLACLPGVKASANMVKSPGKPKTKVLKPVCEELNPDWNAKSTIDHYKATFNNIRKHMKWMPITDENAYKPYQANARLYETLAEIRSDPKFIQ